MARSLREKDINWDFGCLTLQIALYTDLKKLYKGMKKNIKINKIAYKHLKPNSYNN